MSRTLLITAALFLACVASAHAEKPKKWLVLPPVEYDHPYEGELTLERAKDQAEIRAMCYQSDFKAIGVALACTIPRKTSCIVTVVSDEEIRKAGLTPEVVLRHELAHCNGWPGDHKGARWWQKGWAEPREEAGFLSNPKIWEEAIRCQIAKKSGDGCQ